MKLKDGFIVRQIAGSWVAVPVGERTSEMRGLISLSETGAFLWEHLKQDTSFENLLNFLTGEYDVDTETAKKDIRVFLDSLDEKDLILR